MARPDLTVMGAGIFGLSVAWAAARRGAVVRVIEREAIGAGSSGGVVGALAPHVPDAWNEKKAFQLDGLLMAEDWWEAVRAASGLSPGYARVGRVQPLADQAAVTVARGRAAEAARNWQGRAEWRVTESAQGWDLPSPTGLYLLDTLSARIAPRLALAALAAALRATGGDVTLGKAEPHGPVVWATGVDGLEELSRAFGQNAGGGVKGQAAVLALDARDLPQVFADGLHIVPHGDGTVAVGSTSERDWADPGATDAQLDALLDRARALCPALCAARVVERWAGIRPRAATRAPVLGAWPGRPGHYIANGGFKIGFGLAPMVAECLADLVLDGKDRIPAPFRPEACLQPRR